MLQLLRRTSRRCSCCGEEEQAAATSPYPATKISYCSLNLNLLETNLRRKRRPLKRRELGANGSS